MSSGLGHRACEASVLVVGGSRRAFCYPFRDLSSATAKFRVDLRASDQPVSQQFDKRTVLAAHPFFRGVRPAIVDSVVSHAVIRKVKKGTVLFRKGDPGTTLYAVLSGAVQMSAPSRQGQDAIFNLIPSGEIFGEIALLDGGARTADAMIIEDGDLMLSSGATSCRWCVIIPNSP